MRTTSLLALFALLTVSPLSAAREIPKEHRGLPLAFYEEFADAEKAKARFEFTHEKAWEVKEAEGKRHLSLTKQSDYKPPVRSPVNIAWVKDLKVGPEFIMEVRLRSTTRDYGHRDLCLFFGGIDASHFFYVHIAKQADPHANNIFLVDGAPRKAVATQTTKGTDWDDAWHTVRVERDKAGAVKVFFDDKQIITADNASFPEGRVGVGSFDDTGDFGPITVWASKQKFR